MVGHFLRVKLPIIAVSALVAFTMETLQFGFGVCLGAAAATQLFLFTLQEF